MAPGATTIRCMPISRTFGFGGIALAATALVLPFWLGVLLAPGAGALGYAAARQGEVTLGRAAMICGAAALVISLLTGAYVLGSG
jgi:hypothetical protein